MKQGHFEERAPHERGFSEVFSNEILPVFRARREAGRAKHRRIRIVSRGIFAAGIAVTAWLLIAYPFSDKAPRWLLPVFAFASFGILAGALVQGARAKFDTQLKAAVAPAMARFLGFERYVHQPEDGWLDLKDLHRRELLPFYNRNRLEDALEGTWRGVSFRLTELLLIENDTNRENSTDQSVVFSGPVIEVETPVEMPEILFLAHHGKLVDGIRRRILAAQGLRPMPFNDGGTQPYEVFSDDPRAARAHVTLAFAETLLSIAQGSGTRDWRLTAGFRGRQFTLCLYTGKRFLEIEALELDEAEFAESCRAALLDMTLPRRVIDLLIDGPA